MSRLSAGRQVIIAEHEDVTWIIGPVYTATGADRLRELIVSRPGWTAGRAVALVSKAEFEEGGS